MFWLCKTRAEVVQSNSGNYPFKMTTVFEQRLKNLNPEQRRAVEAIEGPVMVVAGPGTGKTEVLAARIANILQKTDSQPHNILCLTFTDAGTIAMRKRLTEFIGSEAYKVNIYTFHAFCNEVIQSNLDYFGKRELSLVSELEVVQFLENLIDTFPTSHALYHVSSYHEVGRLKHLFRTMKAENYTAENVIEAVDTYLQTLPNEPDFQYKRANSSKGIQAGDPNQRLITAETEKMEKLKAAAGEFPRYQEFLKATNCYDYQDMISWLVKAFQENENMLATYQERFLYILVDEYQDTNGSQNEIINLLTNFWDNPNIFIVGDDDQSIFRFQGANLRNIMSFYERHKASVEKIMITKNYRSSQKILNTAASLIEKNSERLINEIPELEKNLTASNADIATSEINPTVSEYYNTAHEEAGIAEIIENLHSNNIDLSEVAVIYREHRQAFNIIKLLEQKKIPLNVKESTNILSLPFMKTILNILGYISGEFEEPYSMERSLFHLLHYEFFNISVRDIALLSAKLKQLEVEHRKRRHSSEGIQQLPSLSPSLRELIADEAILTSLVSEDSKRKILTLGEGLNRWIGAVPSLNILSLLETILEEAGILNNIMNSDKKIWKMRILTTFFNFVKEECYKNPKLTLKELLKMISKMDEHGISMPLSKMTYARKGVNFITAHSSKGHEFKYVFIIGCNAKAWDKIKGRRGQFSFPNTLTFSNTGDDTEETRRLMYVALTRAKKHLNISYAMRDLNDKEIERSQFVTEILEKNPDIKPEEKSLPDDSIARYHRSLMSSMQRKNVQIIESEYLTDLLKDYKLSPTHLNKYLQCPVAFYFENILKVPRPATENMAFGIAVHYALENFFKNAKRLNSFGDLTLLLQYFKQGMELNQPFFTSQQFSRRLEYGFEILKGYHAKYKDTWNTNVRLEYFVWNASLEGIPVTGKIDKIEFNTSSRSDEVLSSTNSAPPSTNMETKVIDYKTGSFAYALPHMKPPSEKDPLGGNYWRQMVFYKILTDLDTREPWRMTIGEIDFIEKDSRSGEYKKIQIPITHEDTEIVKSQIRDVYGKIMRHEFSHGCNEETCTWCEFVKEEYRVGALS